MTPEGHDLDADLNVEEVRLLLTKQGYAVPDADLVEIAADYNALVEGLYGIERSMNPKSEPWPVPMQFLGSEND